jgi:DNA end-binding protein Ku
MAARAIWRASIVFGDVRVKVLLYSAVEPRGVHFRLLHAEDGVPVEQRMVEPESADPVPTEQVKKGYQVAPNVFVVLEEEELASVEPEPSRDIVVTRFVDPQRLGPEWFERPYFLGPDGDAAAYFALVDAMESKEVEGIARWVMRKRPYVGALRVAGDHLALIAMRTADQVVQLPELRLPKEKQANEKELALAEQLVSTLEGDFDPAELRDTYKDRLLRLVKTKARGGKVKLKRPPARRDTEESLAEALRRSVAAAKG